MFRTLVPLLGWALILMPSRWKAGNYLAAALATWYVLIFVAWVVPP